MTSSTPSKTVATSLLSIQNVAGSTVVISSAVDVSTKFAGLVMIHFGRRATTSAVVGVNFRIEASAKSSGDGYWFPIWIGTTAFAATNSDPITSSSASGQNVVNMTSTANMAAGDIVYIDDLNTAANSEWGRIKLVTGGASITLEDNLLATHTNAGSGCNVYRAAEMFAVPLDLSGVTRLRLVHDAAQFTQNHAVEAYLNTLDSVTTA